MAKENKNEARTHARDWTRVNWRFCEQFTLATAILYVWQGDKRKEIDIFYSSSLEGIRMFDQPTTPPLRGGWTRNPMASPQPEEDLRDHTSPITPQTHYSISSYLFYFSSLVFPHSLLDWNRFNEHLITFWMFIVPLLQHLLH